MTEGCVVARVQCGFWGICLPVMVPLLPPVFVVSPLWGWRCGPSHRKCERFSSWSGNPQRSGRVGLQMSCYQTGFLLHPAHETIVNAIDFVPFYFLLYLSCFPVRAVRGHFCPSQTQLQTKKGQSSVLPLQQSEQVGSGTWIQRVAVDLWIAPTVPRQAGLWSSSPRRTPDQL